MFLVFRAQITWCFANDSRTRQWNLSPAIRWKTGEAHKLGDQRKWETKQARGDWKCGLLCFKEKHNLYFIRKQDPTQD